MNIRYFVLFLLMSYFRATCLNSAEIDNEFLKINECGINIKDKAIEEVGNLKLIWIGKSEIFETYELADISYENFQKVSYLLASSARGFNCELIKHLSKNPFEDISANLLLMRPSIWGKQVKPILNREDIILFEIGPPIKYQDYNKVPQLEEYEVEEIFGSNYKQNCLGKGGFGQVFDVNYQGKDYALKKNALEAFDLELLQFTDAVVKVFAIFEVNYETFMIMEKGVKTLHDLNMERKQLEGIVLARATRKFKNLVNAQRIFHINNKDIKPENLLITKDDNLVLIDMSRVVFTPLYIGTEGQLLARVLLENEQGLFGGEQPFTSYFNFPNEQRSKVASPNLMAILMRSIYEELLPGDLRRGRIKNFDDLFDLMPKPLLFKIAKSKNNDIYDQFYGTNLPIPNIQDISDDCFEQYFSKVEAIGSKFCEHIRNFFTHSETRSFFYELDSRNSFKYFNYLCKRQANGSYSLNMSFAGPKDLGFRKFIEDALLPGLKLKIFKKLVSEKHISMLFGDENSFKRSSNRSAFRSCLIELYNY